MAERIFHHQTTELHGEDRLSALPDELLQRILIAAELDILTAVQTSLFSTRWRSLWKSCLRFLQFEPATTGAKRFERFDALVRNALSGPDSDSPLSLLSVTVTVNPSSEEWAELFDRIYAYGLAHRVPTFRFAALQTSAPTRAVSVPSFSNQFASLCASVRNLDLIRSRFQFRNLASQSSNFPALTSLRLHRCAITDHEYSPFASIPNLEKLELTDCEFGSVAVKVSGNNLVDITIAFSNYYQLPQPSIELSAPRCKYLACRGVYVDKFPSVELLPSLECLDMDCRLKGNEDDESNFAFLVSGLQSFGNAECVKLRPNAIKVLTFVPGLLELQTCPFKGKRVKRVELYGPVVTRREFNSLMSYLFDEYIRGPVLYHRTVFGGNARGPVVVCRSDLPSCEPAGPDDELVKNMPGKLKLA